MNFKGKCRICFKSGNIDIFSNDFGTTPISYQITTISNVQITRNDGLPETICKTCLDILKMCQQFIQLVKDTNDHLVKLLNQPNPTSDPMPIDLKDIENVKFTNDNIQKNNITLSSRNSIEPTKTITKLIEKSKEQCAVCGKTFTSKFRLKTHQVTHGKEKPFSCEICDKKFNLLENCKSHLRTHTGEKPLVCTYCGAKFAHSSGLTIHKRRHTNKTYTCKYCSKTFYTSTHLTYHYRWHNDEKNFWCDTCGRKFIRKSDLKQHLLIHHKPFMCSICGHKTARTSALKIHMAGHEQKAYSCDKCPSFFKQMSDLVQHLETHTGDSFPKTTSCEGH